MEQNSELQNYIQRSRTYGTPDDAIRGQLVQNGWPADDIDRAFWAAGPAPVATPARSADPHCVRNGVLWIASPFILLISVALLQFIINFVGFDFVLIKFISYLAGLTGFILIFVGPIIGIIKLTKD